MHFNFYKTNLLKFFSLIFNNLHIFIKLFFYFIWIVIKVYYIFAPTKRNNKTKFKILLIMKATVTHNGKRNEGINAKAHRRENAFMEQYSIIDSDFNEVLTLRIYGTNAKNYACVWTSEKTNWSNGSGSAGGYGYHRPSAAAEEALKKAGFDFSPISGRGDSAIKECLENVAKDVFKLKKYIVHRAHS